MVLKTVHDKVDEIPEAFRELYTEKAGKWELTGIVGIKTEADVARVNTALDAERKMNKEIRAKLAVWGDRNPEETIALLDKIPELEAATKGKLDEAKLDELANKRAEKLIASKIAPVERKVAELTKERDTLQKTNGELSERDIRRAIDDEIRAAASKLKVEPEAVEDALLYGRQLMQRGDDGKVTVRSGVGYTEGLNAEGLLMELQPKRPHWWPRSNGGGAKGGGGDGGIKDNPWAEGSWNLTQQGAFIKTHGIDKANAAAKAAGSHVGAVSPTKKTTAKT